MSGSNSNNSKNSSSGKKRNRTPGSRGSLLNNLAFYAVIFLALVMLINAILAVLDMCGVTISSLQKASGILMQIALAIAIIITVLASYHVARRAKKCSFYGWYRQYWSFSAMFSELRLFKGVL